MDVYFGFLGVFIGSFLNVLGDRLPKGQNVIWGRSHCDHCRKNLRWFELIPVVSYILQRGRCLRCKTQLSAQYPVSELVVGAMYYAIFQNFGSTPYMCAGLMVIFSALFVIAVSDIKYQIIPDSMVIILAVSSALLLIGRPAGDILMYVLSGCVSAALFYALWYFTHGRGMGFGDVKLAGVLGLFLGYPLTVVALYIAFLTGALMGVILILKGSKTLKSKIAFGPFLILGIVLSYFFQQSWLIVWNMYF